MPWHVFGHCTAMLNPLKLLTPTINEYQAIREIQLLKGFESHVRKALPRILSFICHIMPQDVLLFSVMDVSGIDRC